MHGTSVSAQDCSAQDGLRDRVRGCLLGGAVGDALGAPLEFHALADIRRMYGPDGLDEVSWYQSGRRGAITDDTQMTVFTAEGLIRARGVPEEVAPAVYAAHLRWLVTQTFERPPAEQHVPVGGFGAQAVVDGWLSRQQWLYARRAPGSACMNGLLSGRMGTPAAPANPDSKGCGGVMRSAPFGLIPAWSPSQAFHAAAECATQTHGHPSGYLAAGAFAALTRHLLDDIPLDGAIDAVLETLGGHPDHEETSAALRDAVSAARSGGPAPERVEELGGGWVAEEALAIAVYCALSHPDDVRAALLLAVNHSGDSDSTAAICGNLLGVRLGEHALPSDWLEVLEGRETLERLADDFALAFGGSSPYGPDWLDRYPPVREP